MAVVELGRRAVETDLQRDPIARQGPKHFHPPTYEQHPVREHGCGDCRGTRQQDLIDVREKEGLAAGNEDLPDAQLGCFLCDLLYALKAERPPRRFRRRAHATIIAAQVAVEVGVEPQPRPNRTIGIAFRGSLTGPYYPARLICLLGRLNQGVAGEAAPGCKVLAEPRIAANNGEEAAGATTAHRVDQLWKQTGRKGFCTGLDLNPDSHSIHSD